MKKAGKIVAYLLVLVMLASCFTGFGTKSEEVKATDSNGNFVVLEIVPHEDMGTFGYLVAGQEAEFDRTWFTNEITKANSNLKNFMTTNGLWDAASNKSTDYFRTQMGVTKSVDVVVKTPADLEEDSSIIDEADFIVINQTVPSALQASGKTQTAKFYANDFDNWDTILKIFEKIAGVKGNPIPYFIDYQIYYSIVTSNNTNYWVDNIREKEYKNKEIAGFSVSNATQNASGMGYVYADKISLLDREGEAAVTGFGQPSNYVVGYANSSVSIHYYSGSRLFIYKLFRLLATTNPATLYGLYFLTNDDSYGIDIESGDLFGIGPKQENANPTRHNARFPFEYWSEGLLMPWFATNSSGSVTTTMSTMNWFDPKSENPFSDFAKVIGGQKGSGVVYNSTSLGVVKAFNPSSDGGAGGGGSDVPSGDSVNIGVTEVEGVATAVTGAVDASHDSGDGATAAENVTDKNAARALYIYNKTGSDVSNWYIKIHIEGLESFSTYWAENSTVSADLDNDIITITGTGSLSNNGKVLIKFACGAANPFAYYIVLPTPSPTPDPEPDDDFVDVDDDEDYVFLDSFLDVNNDYHPYRFLVITDSSVSGTINRSMIADMVSYANKKGIGLAGGIQIDCISKYHMEDYAIDLNSTYDGIYNGTTGLSTAALSRYNKYTKTSKYTSDGRNKLIKRFKSLLNNSPLGVVYNTTPQEYYTNFLTTFNSFNAGTGGTIQSLVNGDLTVPGDENYINSDSYNATHNSKTLDFDFTVYGGGSTITATLYVDKNHNDLYDDDLAYSIAKADDYSSTNNRHFSDQIPVETVLEANYVGGFGWKIVISDGTNSVSKIGYSAFKKTGNTAKKIKILQVYPTHYKTQYGDQTSGSMLLASNPLLILPTDSERGTTNLSTTYSYNDDYDDLVEHFNNKLQVDTCTTAVDRLLNSSEVDQNPSHKLSLTDGGGTDIIGNASLMQYFIDKLVDYDLSVTRYSVFGFSNACDGSDPQIVYNPKTKKLGVALKESEMTAEQKQNAEKITNPDGSLRYGYTAIKLRLDTTKVTYGGEQVDKWKTETVTWFDGDHPKYLVDSISNKIYGERLSYDYGVKYYGKKVNISTNPESEEWVEGDTILSLTEDFDLLVLGFGFNMDYMGAKALQNIQSYLAANGPTLAGYGTVTLSSNNNLGRGIASYLGMYSDFSDYTSGDDAKKATFLSHVTADNKTSTSVAQPGKSTGCETQMIINDTLFSHYPFRVNQYMMKSNAAQSPMKLDLDTYKDIVVSHAMYMTSGSANNYSNWGDSKENYYLYKKGNITYCGFGDTMANTSTGQQGMTLPLMENVLVVNALVTASNADSGGDADLAWFKITDADRSELQVPIQDDELTKAGVTIWKDAAYTDFDSLGIAGYKKDDDITVAEQALKSGSIVKKTEKIGEVTYTYYYRRIKYKAKSALGEAYLDIKDAKGVSLMGSVKTVGSETVTIPGIKIYKEGESDPINKKNSAGNGQGMYKIDENTVYYLEIPITPTDPIYVKSGSHEKLGFNVSKTVDSDDIDFFNIVLTLYAENESTGNLDVVENHLLTNIRRLVYPLQ